MPRSRRSVTPAPTTPVPLPSWAAAGAVTALELLRRLPLGELSTRVVLDRKKGAFAGIDVWLFLVLFFSSGVSLGLQTFAEDVRRYASQLAAVAGRRALPSSAALSRALDAVNLPALRAATGWLLSLGGSIDPVLRHPSALLVGARGAKFHVFDLDKTLTVLTQRPLGKGPGLPAGKHRSHQLAAPGPAGRKRGNVQFHRAVLQHAGSGMWITTQLRRDGGGRWAELDAALDVIVETVTRLGLPANSAVLRADGEYGYVPGYARCRAKGVRFVTRLTRPEFFEIPEVRTRICDGEWYRVIGDGTGVERSAMELGRMSIPAGKRTVTDDDEAYEPVDVRVVVSRYRRGSEAEHGVVIDGWQYELFVVDIDTDEIPAEDAVRLYFARATLENRLAQEDRELRLDHTFSYNLAGQELAVVVGLMVWNLQVLLGFEQGPPPNRLPRAAPSTRVRDPRPVPAATRPEPPPAPDPADSARPVHPQAAIAAKLPGLPWSSLLGGHPGWSWDEAAQSLRCPNGEPQRLSSSRTTTTGRAALFFKSRVGACEGCPLRANCNRSPVARQPKMSQMNFDAQLLVDAAAGAPRRSRPRLLDPPHSGTRESSAREVRTPRFLPAVARAKARSWLHNRNVVIKVAGDAVRVIHHSLLAADATAVRHGRRSVAERVAHYALPSNYTVSIELDGQPAEPSDGFATSVSARAA